MLRTACLRLIRSCHEHKVICDIGPIYSNIEYKLNDDDRKLKCEEYIRREEVHVEIRNLIMMVLLQKKLHKDDESQEAYLRAAVSRVRS